MSRLPCEKCPFRPNGLPYNVDGIELLDAGEEPGCHEKVGDNLQFNDYPSDETACIGYQLRGTNGYLKTPKIEVLL